MNKLVDKIFYIFIGLLITAVGINFIIYIIKCFIVIFGILHYVGLI